MSGLTTQEVDALFKYLDKGLDQLVVNVRDEVVAEIKEKTPVLTGRLQDSIHAEDTAYGFDIVSDVEYAEYVEYGTPKMAPRLMITSTINDIDRILEHAAKKAGLL